MKHINKLSVLAFTILLLPAIAYAVDETSNSYKVGHYVGYAFGIVLLILIIKKLLGK